MLLILKCLGIQMRFHIWYSRTIAQTLTLGLIWETTGLKIGLNILKLGDLRQMWERKELRFKKINLESF